MKLHPTPVHDPHWEGTEIAACDLWRYVWLWYGFNLRLIVIPQGEITAAQYGYAWAWCYPRDPDVIRRSVADWNPDTQDEPLLWHKRPTTRRLAPHRDPADPYNRPRCEHGGYMDDGGCHVAVCHTTIRYRQHHCLAALPTRTVQS